MNNLSNEQLQVLVAKLKDRNINTTLVESKDQVLDEVLKLIPSGATVMNGSSTTLIETGVVDYMKDEKPDFKNLHVDILKEQDYAKGSEMRRLATTADVFLGSVNAITEDGILVATDNTGSRVGAYLFSAKQLILVVGVNKVVGDLQDAFKHITEVVLPLESERAHKAYGVDRSYTNKWMIIEKENDPNRIHMILVNEHLGF